MWIRFKDRFKKGGWDKPEWVVVDEATLRRFRDLVSIAIQEHIRSVGDTWWVGLTPRTFSASVLAAHIPKSVTGMDLLWVQYASYMPLAIARGSWEEGPVGRWRKLPTVIPYPKGLIARYEAQD